jgi:hypothetical protein
VTSPLFQSFARNGEDVVLWRALGGVAPAAVLELTAEGPAELPGQYSATRALAERGWSVVRLIDTELSALSAAEISAMVTDRLAAAGLTDRELPALVIDAPQLAERCVAALAGAGLRPWVVVVSAAELAVTEAQEALRQFSSSSGYQLCLFDGVNGYFAHPEHAGQLGPALSYPAGSRDLFASPALGELEREHAALTAELAEAAKTIIQWRAAALQRWDVAASAGQASHAYRELEAMRNTVSWRVTRPLRAVRRRIPVPGSGG